MGLFGFGKKKKEEYDFIFNNGDDSSIDYSDLDENEDPEEVIERLRGTIISGDCPYCNGKNTMHYRGNCFICSSCGNSEHEDLYYRWVAGYPIKSDHFDIYLGDPSYEDVYGEDGDSVYCDFCSTEIKWKDGQYLCPECGKTISRDVFFNYIGAEPPGPECVVCSNLYPGCVICPYGYIKDNNF